ncbi:MAG TPA: STAS domain-containing protein [Acidimicrobiales bacterium]|nr:STAS domain-containing protein [Acidimicrobiales bacterium]
MTGPTPFGGEPLMFEIHHEQGSVPPCLRLSGEMDLRAATDLREELLKALAEGHGNVVLDLAELSFIDSTIISVLIMARKRAGTLDGEVRLRNVPGRIQRILTITGIDSLFSTDDAVPDSPASPTA